MKRIQVLTLMVIIALIEIGCEGSIKEFVGTKTEGVNQEPSVQPPVSANPVGGLTQLSGGGNLSGVQIKSKLNMNNTNQVLSGSRFKAVISIDQVKIQ